MENKLITEQNKGYLPRKIDVGFPKAMEMLKTRILCCLLDEDLTFWWANSSFFSSIGYSRDSFCDSFRTLRQYYGGLPDEFTSFQQKLLQANENSNHSIEIVVRLPLKEGGFSWAQLYGTISQDSEAGGPVLQAEFVNMDALVAENEEQTRLYGQKLQYFHWMLDAYEGNVYVSDMDTYELLYLNKTACGVLGEPAVKVVGRKCYEVIQGRKTSCPFCTNDKLTEDDFYEWEFYNPVLRRTFMIKDRLIDWEGRKARLELSHDMFSAEYKLAKKDQERDALIRSVPGGLARVDGRDMRTVL